MDCERLDLGVPRCHVEVVEVALTVLAVVLADLEEANDQSVKLLHLIGEVPCEAPALVPVILHGANDATWNGIPQLAIDKIEVGVEIPAKLFSQSNLTKGK